MPYTMENFKHDVAKEYLPLLTSSERLEGLSDDDLKELSIDRRLKGLSAEELRVYLEQLESNSTKTDKS